MTEQTTITISEFAKKHELRVEFREVRRNPNMEGMDKNARHYDVTLYRGPGTAYSMNLYYSKGSALPRGVKVEEVLDCLASDAAGYDNARDFEDWASEYGYDPDSRKAEGIYDLIGRQCRDLQYVLKGQKGTHGNSAYAELLYEVERL